MHKGLVLVDLIHLHTAETGVKKFTEDFIELAQAGDREYEYHFLPSKDRFKATSKGRQKRNFVQRLYINIQLIIWRQFYIPWKAWRLGATHIVFPDYCGCIWPTSSRKIIVFHDTFFWDSPEHYGFIWGVFFRWLAVQSVKYNATVMTISKTAKERIERIIPKNVPIVVIPHAYRALSGKRSQASLELRDYGLIKNAYFLHVGVFEKRKSLTTLIYAFKEFLRNSENGVTFKLVLVGKSPKAHKFDDFPHMEKVIDELDLHDKVVLPGYISDADIALLYEYAFAYVFPSNNEGFGIPILEAFEMNCPVILSSQKALKEIASIAGLVFEMNDHHDLANKMNLLWRDAELRENLIKSGALRLQDFDRQDYMKKMENALEEMHPNKL